tara:strand:- start:401 stop:691 length:291 start_codon:yes stop_codon:yes gene_type:complete
MKRIFKFIVLGLFFSFNANAEYRGRYCEIDVAYTESGEIVYGEFYMFSENYGEADSVYTESGDYIYGQCYRQGDYCEMIGVYTGKGEYVYGECYIY